MSILIKGMEIPEDNTVLLRVYPESDGVFYVEQLDIDDDILDKYWAVPVPEHGRLIDADALTGQMERNLWAIEDKAEKELGFDETLRRGMQYGHAVCVGAVNDAPTIIQADQAKEEAE